MTKRKAFTLVELLVVIAIIAVLLAILMPSLSGAKALAKRLQCARRLGGIGRAFNMYVEASNGQLPQAEYYERKSSNNQPTWIPQIESCYLLAKREINTPAGQVNKFKWRHFGCLYGAGYIDDGKVFYCPAVDGWMEEYKAQCQPDWANLNHNWNQGPKATKGYSYWPIGKEIITQQQWSDMSAVSSSLSTQRNYVVGLPGTPDKITDLQMVRPIASDHTFHAVKGKGWNLNTLYPDGHVLFQGQPRNSADLGLWCANENEQWPEEVYENGVWKDATEQDKNIAIGVTPVEYSLALEQ